MQLRAAPSADIPWETLRRAGVATLIVPSFRDDVQNGGLFFRNGVVAPLRREIEASVASRRGPVALWGWLIGRKYSWLGRSSLADRQREDGRLSPSSKLDLFQPGAVDLMVGLFRDLARTGVDGILIQDDLVMRAGEGLSEGGGAELARRSGLPVSAQDLVRTDHPLLGLWTQLKCERVAEVVRQIVTAVHQENPRLQVGVNVYYETALTPDHGREWLAQDLDLLLETGVDRVYLMAYHRQMKAELRLDEAENRRRFAGMVERAWRRAGDRLVVKLQGRDFDTKERIPTGEMQAYLALIPAGVKRVCLTSIEWGDLPWLAGLNRREP